MNESMVPVCSPEYAERHDLVGKPFNLRQCTLLHDRQAWSYDSDQSEWHSWAQHFKVDIAEDQRSMGFDRSDLAVIAAMNHVGIAMGRKNWSIRDWRQKSSSLPSLSLKCSASNATTFQRFQNASGQKLMLSFSGLKSWPKPTKVKPLRVADSYLQSCR